MFRYRRWLVLVFSLVMLYHPCHFLYPLFKLEQETYSLERQYRLLKYVVADRPPEGALTFMRVFESTF